jgi:uncharacterized surface anchored protein
MGSAGAIQPGPIHPTENESALGQNVITEDRSVQSLPTQNAVNSFAPVANDAVVSQNQSSQQAAAPRSSFHGGAVAGTLQSNNNLPQAEANAQNRQQQKGMQQTASQTVQVQADAAAPLVTDSAGLSSVIAGRATSNLSFTQQPLPSGLAILSSAAQGPMELAIDTHHAVFVSNDSGLHWKTVRAAWKGRAVMVEAAAPVKMLAMPSSGASVGFSAGLAQGAVAAKKARIALTGTVTDPSGAVIPGATVTVTDPQTHLTRSMTTDANGRYFAAGLDPGRYDLEATALGFMSDHLSNVTVAASIPNVANFTLRVGASSETVTVENSDASVELKAAPRVKTARVEKAKQALVPLFEIVTDKGVHWTSADGLTWQPK